VKLSFQTLNC